MPVEITRRSFIGASALALACITPLAGCSSSSGGSSSPSSSPSSSDANDGYDAGTSESGQEEEITVSNAQWVPVYIDAFGTYLRCTGTVTNNTDRDIGEFDIYVKCTKRYTDKYGEVVEEEKQFSANNDVIAVSGCAVEEVDFEKMAYMHVGEYRFMDLRAHESVDFDYFIRPDEYDREGGDDTEFVDPRFKATAYSHGQAVLDRGDNADRPEVVDRLHDLPVKVVGGPAIGDVVLQVTNNTGNYIDSGEVHYSYRFPTDGYAPDGEGDYKTVETEDYGKGYKHTGLMKPGDTVEIALDDTTYDDGFLIDVTHVVYHVDEDK